MELLSQAFAANEVKVFSKAGRFFEIITADQAIARVEFGADQGQQSDSMINPQSGLYVEDPFSYFQVTNGAFAQTITMLIMENGRGGSRRQPGNVRVINNESDKTLALTQLMAGGMGGTPAAGTQRVVGIKLSAAGQTAQKRLSILAVHIQSSIAGLASIGYTDYNNGLWTSLQVFNKFGAILPSSNTDGCTQDVTAQMGPYGIGGNYRLMMYPYVKANEHFTWVPKNPVVVSGTYIFAVGGGATGARDIISSIEFEEI